MRAVALAMALLIARVASAAPDGLELVQRLGASSRADVERAVADIEAAPANTQDLDEALKEAARACEDVIADPVHALAIYDRILKEFPNSSASRIARVRGQMLRDRIGGTHAQEARDLARLVADADTLAPEAVMQRGDALAATDWPGNVDAALFVAEWLQRRGELPAAAKRFEDVERRWPDRPQAIAARRGAASVAIARHQWDRAKKIIATLPAVDDADRVLRDELAGKITRGRKLDFWYGVSWAFLIASIAGLLASLGEAWRRAKQRPPWKPPVEVLFLLPVAAVLFGVALTTHRAIAPAVFVLSVGGLLLAWLSGITLELLRAKQRPVGRRAAFHVALCFIAVLALLYIVLTHGDLLEMMIETVKFGPDP